MRWTGGEGEVVKTMVVSGFRLGVRVVYSGGGIGEGGSQTGSNPRFINKGVWAEG